MNKRGSPLIWSEFLHPLQYISLFMCLAKPAIELCIKHDGRRDFLPSLKTFDSKKFIPHKHIELHPTTLL